MPIIPCPDFSPCTDQSIPTANFSSEAPDPNFEIAYGYGYTGFVPPLGSMFTGLPGPTVCEATTLAQAILCGWTLLPGATRNPTPGNPTSVPWSSTSFPSGFPVFSSSEQVCPIQCPDGNTFDYTIPAGAFTAFSQSLADQMAQSYACQFAYENRVCLSDIPVNICIGQLVAFDIEATGPGPYVFDIVAGDLPAGLVMTVVDFFTVNISGTPTVADSFAFALTATAPDGSFMRKNYSLGVIGIANSSPLPSGNVGVAYSNGFLDDGPAIGVVAWSVSDGALPDGLTLNASTGTLSGTPTTVGTFNFTIRMSDES